jgi:hypothetical protein
MSTFNDAYDEIERAFRGGEGTELWDKGKEIITPYLQRWAEARVMILTGNDVQKLIGYEIVRSMQNSVSDIAQAYKAKLVNYALEKLEQILRNIVTKQLLPLLLS